MTDDHREHPSGHDEHSGADPGRSGTLGGPSADETPEPVYPAVEDWVSEYFLPMFRRTLGGEYRWCGQWWQHGEAISRLTALWHAWEVLRLQPGTGIATWYHDHLDQQLPVLMGSRGPFYQCSETVHREPREAAATPAPGDWWDLDDDILLSLGIEEPGEKAQGKGQGVAMLGDVAEERPGAGAEHPGPDGAQQESR